MKESTKQTIIWSGILAAVILAIVLVNVLDRGIWYKLDGNAGYPNKGFALIDTIEEYNQVFSSDLNSINPMLEKKLGKYDERFFKNKSIVVLAKTTNNSNHNYNLRDVYVEGNTLYVEYIEIKIPGMALLEVGSWTNCITVRKSAIKKVEYIQEVYLPADSEEWVTLSPVAR